MRKEIYKPDRLFIPLNKEAFLAFEFLGKRYEVRAIGNNFSYKTVEPGRPVELRVSYSKGMNTLYGTIGQVVIGSLEQIFETLPLQLVEPGCESIQKAIEDNKALLGDKSEYIAFEINFVKNPKTFQKTLPLAA